MVPHAFSIPTIVRFQRPEADWRDVSLDAYLDADMFYCRCNESYSEQDLNKLILCLYKDSCLHDIRQVEMDAWRLAHTPLSMRHWILSEYMRVRTELENYLPYAFVKFRNTAKAQGTKSLRETLLYLFRDELPLNVDAMKFFGVLNGVLKQFYDVHGSADITKDLFLTHSECGLPEIVEIDSHLFKCGEVKTDPQQN
jgi:hypothetical protein